MVNFKQNKSGGDENIAVIIAVGTVWAIVNRFASNRAHLSGNTIPTSLGETDIARGRAGPVHTRIN